MVIKIANQEARILLTQDKDFGELVYRLKKLHFGIILVRLTDQPSIVKAALINRVLYEYGNKLGNAFTVIQKNAIRIRK